VNGTANVCLKAPQKPVKVNWFRQLLGNVRNPYEITNHIFIHNLSGMGTKIFHKRFVLFDQYPCKT